MRPYKITTNTGKVIILPKAKSKDDVVRQLRAKGVIFQITKTKIEKIK